MNPPTSGQGSIGTGFNRDGHFAGTEHNFECTFCDKTDAKTVAPRGKLSTSNPRDFAACRKDTKRETRDCPMLTISEVAILNRQRAWILYPAMAIGTLAVFGYLGLAAIIRNPLVDWIELHIGATSAEMAPMLLVLPSIAFFLVPLVRAERKAKRYALICPQCANDITCSTARVIATRCCSSCRVRVVQDGRIRDSRVFDRYSRRNRGRFLVYWLWAWPFVGATAIAFRAINPSALENCSQTFFLPGLVGTAAAAWSFVRTFDNRYRPPLIASAILFVWGVFAYW